MMNVSGASSISLSVFNNLSHEENAVMTQVYSQKYMINLIQISILNILHHRVAIPEDQWEERFIGNVPYKVCVRKSQNRFIRTYHALGKGITDAVQKNYLDEIHIHLTSKATKEPIETFKLKLKCNNVEKLSKKQRKSIKEVEEATMKYLEELQNMELSEERKLFEKECDLYCELLYNEDTPKNYQPKNFEESKRILSSFEPGNLNLGLGYISSGYHKFSAWMDQKLTSEPVLGNMEIVEAEPQDENTEIIKLSNTKSDNGVDNDAEKNTVAEEVTSASLSATPKKRTPTPRKKRKTKRNLKRTSKKLKARIKCDESSSFEAELLKPLKQTKSANSNEFSSRNCTSTSSNSNLTLIL